MLWPSRCVLKLRDFSFDINLFDKWQLWMIIYLLPNSFSLCHRTRIIVSYNYYAAAVFPDVIILAVYIFSIDYARKHVNVPNSSSYNTVPTVDSILHTRFKNSYFNDFSIFLWYYRRFSVVQINGVNHIFIFASHWYNDIYLVSSA